jgi:Ca2+-binding RTX toxin-like protein
VIARALIALLALLVLAAPAGAATALTETRCSSTDRFGNQECWLVASYEAEPGEANRLTATYAGGAVTYRDDAVGVRAGAGCEQLAANAVRCVARYASGDTGDLDDTLRGDVAVGLGAGADRADMSGGGAAGGPGDDVLIGSDVGESFSGGEGDDRIVAGGGFDDVYGGPGVDDLDAGTGRDRIDAGEAPSPPVGDRVVGGAGRDEIQWRDEARSIVVDLADPAPDGPRGGPDRIAGVEDVRGGPATDRIAGDGEDNALDGGTGGPDVILGRGGDDRLSTDYGGRSVQRGGPGDDRIDAFGPGRIYGGPGDDHLVNEDASGGPATAHCGRGEDRLTAGGYDFPLRGCEVIEFTAADLSGLIDTRPTVSARGASFRVRCYGRCRGAVTLSDASLRRVGRRAFSGRGWVTRSVTVPLPPHVVAALRSPGGWSGRVRIDMRIHGFTDRAAFRGRLRARLQ